MLPSSNTDEVTTARNLARSRLTQDQRQLAAMELIADELEAIRFILSRLLSAQKP